MVFRARLSDHRRTQIGFVEAALAGIAVATSGGSRSPLLPYLLAPSLALGLLQGQWAVVRGGAIAALSLVVTRAVANAADNLREFTVAAGQWVLLGLAVGSVAAWARMLIAAPGQPTDPYIETRRLLEQLRTVTRGLPGGLDATSAAEGLLEEAARLAPHQRSAVLVQTVEGGALVPLAVRGTKRVPWRAPLTEPGPLRSAWETRELVVDRRPPDKHGRRRGGALAAVPLRGGAAPSGLIVLESTDEGGFTPAQLAAVQEAVDAVALQLETALLFDEVRSVATAEERNRLAREMHDGVAQDLAFMGYQLDELRGHAQKTDPALGDRVSELRKEMTALINNLRLSITDLKTSVSADRGLGAALGSYIRAIGTGRALTVHLSLQESPFRLPPDREVVLFQIAQIVAQDVRQAGRAGNLWVTLSVDPPSARLVVEHDDGSEAAQHDLAEVAVALERLGGSLDVRPRHSGGVRVEAAFEGDDDADQRAAGR